MYFADQNWRRPRREAYMTALARLRPAVATVLDWEEPDQLPEVLSWAEEAAGHVTLAVCVVPKVPGGVSSIPRQMAGKDVILAYSVPTRHGASPVPLWELRGWPVHLLGGSPQRQVEVWSYLRGICDVRSVDGNMSKRMAVERCLYWTRETTEHGHWQPFNHKLPTGAPDECIRRSLTNVLEAWQGHDGG